MCHRVIPAKTERGQQLINGIRWRRRKKKPNDAGQKKSAYCTPVTIENAVRLDLYLRVRRPHFDRHSSGTLEAGKLRARVNSVKSGVPAHGDVNRFDRFATTTASVTNKAAAKFFLFPSNTRASLSSQEDFCS
jgi:hypothetical protein